MKRTISILLTVLLLLVAVPTFAEGEATLQPGLYVAGEGNNDVLYLDERGCGVLNYFAAEQNQEFANGVRWTGTTLEIERADVPFTLMGDTIVFTYDGAVRMFRYANDGSEDYAMGDGKITSFAGTYLAEDGRKLDLAADGQGVFAGADGESAVFWGSLVPYWPGKDVTNDLCYVLFDSYLASMKFQEGQVAVDMDDGNTVVFVRQAQTQPAGDSQLYYGYRMTNDGQTMDLIPFLTAMGMDPKGIYLELRPDGTGTLQFMDEEDRIDFTWTEDAFTVDGESAPYTREGDHIILSIEDESIEFVPAAEFEALLGGSDTETEGNTTTETAPVVSGGPVGSWTFTKAKAMGMEIPASMMGTTMGLVVNEDGTAVLTTDGSDMKMDWTVREDGSIVLSVAGSEVFTLIYDGTYLTLDAGAGGVEMIFEKDA